MRIYLYIRRIVFIYCFFILALSLGAQSLIKNPSFEGRPQDATMPDGWFACSKGTSPDILPGSWGVYLPPADGQSYLGLITRDDDSSESIGQRLTTPLKSGQCYTFALDLAHSVSYAGYHDVIRIEVYASKKKCREGQVVYRSPPIQHTSWQNYSAKFVATSSWKYIMVRASSDHRITNGNILIDGMTDLRPCQRALVTYESKTGW